MEDDFVKFCQHHGYLTLAQVNKSGKLANDVQNYKCKACHKLMAQSHYKRNKEKVDAKHREYKLRDIAAFKAMKYRSQKKNAWKHRVRDNLRRAAFGKVAREELKDTYIKTVLVKRTNIKRKDIPNEMIETKRTLLILKDMARKIAKFQEKEIARRIVKDVLSNE